MLSSIVKGLLGAVLSALNDYLTQRRAEALLREAGRLEERVHAEIKRKEGNAAVRAVVHRAATDPEYAERVREHFRSRTAGS